MLADASTPLGPILFLSGCESGECYYKTWYYDGKEHRGCSNPGGYDSDWCPTRDGVDESNEFVKTVDGKISNKWAYCSCGSEVPGRLKIVRTAKIFFFLFQVVTHLIVFTRPGSGMERNRRAVAPQMIMSMIGVQLRVDLISPTNM